MKLVSTFLLSLSAIGLYSCAEQVEKKEDELQSSSDDNSELATSGGLELSQPKLDAFVPARFYSIIISKAKCEPIAVPSKLGLESPLPNQPKESQDKPQSEKKEDVSENDVIIKHTQPQKCEIAKFFAAKMPYVAGKSFRVKIVEDGKYHVNAQVLGESSVLLEGQALVDVVGGRGKVNITLLPPNSEPGLIITTTIGVVPTPPSAPTPQVNPYPEIKDYLQYPGTFVTRDIKVGIASVNLRRLTSKDRDKQLANIISANPSDGVKLTEIKRDVEVNRTFSQDFYTFTFSKPGRYIIRAQSLEIWSQPTGDDFNMKPIANYHIFNVK